MPPINSPHPFGPQFMRQRWFKSFATPQTTKDGTMDSLVTQCSYGKWAFNDFENLVVPVIVDLPCSGRGSLGDWSASNCRDVDRQGWAEAAMKYLTDVSGQQQASRGQQSLCRGRRGTREVKGAAVHVR